MLRADDGRIRRLSPSDVALTAQCLDSGTCCNRGLAWRRKRSAGTIIANHVLTSRYAAPQGCRPFRGDADGPWEHPRCGRRSIRYGAGFEVAEAVRAFAAPCSRCEVALPLSSNFNETDLVDEAVGGHDIAAGRSPAAPPRSVMNSRRRIIRSPRRRALASSPVRPIRLLLPLLG